MIVQKAIFTQFKSGGLKMTQQTESANITYFTKTLDENERKQVQLI